MSDEYDNGYSDGYDEGLAEMETRLEQARADLAAVTAERDRLREALKDCEKEMRSIVSYIRIAPNTKWDRDSGILLEVLRKADAARDAIEGVTEPTTGDSNA